MPTDTLATHLDLHARMIEIAEKARLQVEANPHPAEVELHPELPHSPTAPYERGK